MIPIGAASGIWRKVHDRIDAKIGEIFQRREVTALISDRAIEVMSLDPNDGRPWLIAKVRSLSVDVGDHVITIPGPGKRETAIANISADPFGLPDQSGMAGAFLTTDGGTPSWEVVAPGGGIAGIAIEELGVPQLAAATTIDFEFGFNVYGVSGGLVRVEVDTPQLAETIRDTIGAALVAGTNIALTVNDAGNTITIALASTVTDPTIEIVGAGALTVEDTRFLIQDNTDPTKQARIGASNITGGAIRNFELPPGGAANLVGADSVQTIQNKTVDATNAIDPAAVTGLAELIRDTIGTALVAGTNVTINVNDAGDTITINAASGGGGAPTGAKYIVQTADAGLSAEQALDAIASLPGIAKINADGSISKAAASDIPLDADLTTIAGLTATTDNVIQSVAGAWASRTMAQLKTTLALAMADVSGLVSALAAKFDNSWLKGFRVTPAQTFTAATATNITGMSFAVTAGEVWQFEFVCFVGVNNTGGVRFTFTCPTGYGLQSEAIGNLGSLTTVNHSRIDTAGTLSSAFHTFNAQTGVVRIVGTLTNTGGGTLQLQGAAGTAGQTVTIHAGSYFIARRLA